MFLFNKFIAVVCALILAFPPVVDGFGRTEGLLMSLSLVLFFLVRGLLSVSGFPTLAWKNGSSMTPAQFLQFAELPLIGSVVWAGLNYLPVWLAWPYEKLLLACTPLFVLLEGLSALIIILEVGERLCRFFERSYEDSSDGSRYWLGKLLLVAFGAFLYAVSIAVLLDVYTSGRLGIVSASFVASMATLLAVMTLGTVAVPHASVGDAALLALYCTYNVWCITRQTGSRRPGFWLSRLNSLLNYFTPLPLTPSTGSITRAVNAWLSAFGMEIVVHLTFQACVFLVALRLVSRALSASSASDPGSESGSGKDRWVQDWIFNQLWPSFGKLILTLIYTYAWLQRTVSLAGEGEEEELFFHGDKLSLILRHCIGWTWPVRWWSDVRPWRYLNIVFALFVYGKHLLTDPRDSLLL